jgi:hypothetical protein
VLQHLTHHSHHCPAAAGIRYSWVESGIGNILNYQADTAGVDFSLRGRIEQQLLSFSLILNNPSFAALTITYIVTARQDILAGSYIAGTTPIMQTPISFWSADRIKAHSSPSPCQQQLPSHLIHWQCRCL